MKKELLLHSFLFPCIVFSQQVYTWNNMGLSWTNPSSWTPNRTTPAANDILEFNASSNVTGMPATENIGRIRVFNNATVNFNSAVSSIIKIGDPTVSTPNFLIESGSILNISGTNDISLSILSGFGGTVNGKIQFAGGAHHLLSADASSLIFQNGSVFSTASGFTGNPFGTSALNSVIFQSGASYENKSGSNPFGAAQPNTVVNFLSGSNYFQQTATSMSLVGRTYGNVEIDANNTFNIPFNTDCIIQNNLRLNGFNFSFTPSSGTGALRIGGDIICNGTANLILGVAGSSNAVILQGTNQFLGSGSGTGSITIQNLTTNNLQTTLQKSVTINGSLNLINGIILSTAAQLITLSANAGITTCMHNYSNLPYTNIGCDISFIQGPIRKLGLSSTSFFGFPVGKNGKLRPLFLTNATGDFTIEYVHADPHAVSSNLGTGINHISNLEYWLVEGSGTSEVELCFFDPNSGGVSNLGSLRMSRFDGSSWIDDGVLQTLGTAGSNGSIRGNSQADFGEFTLASNTGLPDNPLPEEGIKISTSIKDKGVLIRCELPANFSMQDLTPERSSEGLSFRPLTNPGLAINHFNREAEIFDQNPCEGRNYYRIRASTTDNLIRYSKITRVDFQTGTEIHVSPNPTSGKICIKLPTSSSISNLRIVNTTGSVLREINHFTASSGLIFLDISYMPSGVYVIEGSQNQKRFFSTFIKF